MFWLYVAKALAHVMGNGGRFSNGGQFQYN
jgi:hypothetical protein